MFFLFQGSVFVPFSSSVLGRVSHFRIPTNNLYDEKTYISGVLAGKHISLVCWMVPGVECLWPWFMLNKNQSFRKKRRAELKSPTFTYQDSCIFPFNNFFWNQLPRGSRVYDTFVPFTTYKHGGGDGKSTWLDNFAAGSSPPEMRLDIGGKWSGKAHFLKCKPSVVTVTEGVSDRKILHLASVRLSDWVTWVCFLLKLLHHLLDKKISFQKDILFYQPPFFQLKMATPLETVYPHLPGPPMFQFHDFGSFCGWNGGGKSQTELELKKTLQSLDVKKLGENWLFNNYIPIKISTIHLVFFSLAFFKIQIEFLTVSQTREAPKEGPL